LARIDARAPVADVEPDMRGADDAVGDGVGDEDGGDNGGAPRTGTVVKRTAAARKVSDFTNFVTQAALIRRLPRGGRTSLAGSRRRRSRHWVSLGERIQVVDRDPAIR